MYGKGMLEESVNAILNEKLFGYLDAEKIGFFGSPLMADDAQPIDFDAKTKADYPFVFDLGLKPVFDLQYKDCLLYTSDAADDLLCVHLGGRRIIKQKKTKQQHI